MTREERAEQKGKVGDKKSGDSSGKKRAGYVTLTNGREW